MRNQFCLIAAFVCLVLATDTSAESPYESPAMVYSAAQAAVAKNDYQGLCNCLTGDSLEIWAWMTVVVSQSARQQLEKEPDESNGLTPKMIDTVLSAHGLSKQEFERAIALSLAKPKNERGQVFSVALKGVKHKPRFIVDAYLELRKMKTDISKFDPMRIFDWIKPDFVDLVIDGDSATAQVPQPEGAAKNVRAVQFRREGDGWLIHFSMDFKK